MRTSERAEKGRWAERVAASALTRGGLVKMEQNYRCRFGEIDLIMRDRDQIVFVEVRCRGGSSFADAFESVDIHKQRKLAKTAEHYLQQNPRLSDNACRFDVVSVSEATSSTTLTHEPCVNWIKNAFST